MSLLKDLQKDLDKQLYKATHHRFTDELCDGTLSDARLHTYLRQDQKFFMTSLRLFARTLQLCDSDEAVIVLGKQLGFICSDENNYFEECLRGVPPMQTLPEVSKFLDFLVELNSSETYVQNIVALYTFELVYLLWAEPYETKVAHLEFKHKEWVYLHSGAAFKKWVQFLGSEVERVLTKDNLSVAHETMSRVLDLEYTFFECTYNYK